MTDDVEDVVHGLETSVHELRVIVATLSNASVSDEIGVRIDETPGVALMVLIVVSVEHLCKCLFLMLL